MLANNWSEAFLGQAKSDFSVMEMLNESDFPDCHWFHYLQMTTEKLGKAMLSTSAPGRPPKFTHVALVRSLQLLKANPRVRAGMKMDGKQFAAYIDSLLDLASWIERLAPGAAGQEGANPEYPWADRTSKELIVSADFSFSQYSSIYTVQLIKLNRLLRSLLKNGF